jgi:hypothetical protein
MALLRAHVVVAETQLTAAHHSHTRHPPPLSPQRSASAYRTSQTRGGSARAGQTLGMQANVTPRWSRALGRGTYGGYVVGQDGQGLLRTLHRQVRRLLARRAASPNPDGRLEHTPLHPAARRSQHDGGTPWSVPAALRVAALRVRVRELPSCGQRAALSQQCRWESQQCTASLPIHAHPPMRLLYTGALSEAQLRRNANP